MSWVRWGSWCGKQGSYMMDLAMFCNDPDRRAERERDAQMDIDCKDCPGSNLYIYESCNGGIVCCSCSLHDHNDFTAQDEAGMLAHIQDHVKAGHHTYRHLMHKAAK